MLEGHDLAIATVEMVNFLMTYIYFLKITCICVCLYVSTHACKQILSEVRGARSPGGGVTGSLELPDVGAED